MTPTPCLPTNSTADRRRWEAAAAGASATRCSAAGMRSLERQAVQMPKSSTAVPGAGRGRRRHTPSTLQRWGGRRKAGQVGAKAALQCRVRGAAGSAALLGVGPGRQWFDVGCGALQAALHAADLAQANRKQVRRGMTDRAAGALGGQVMPHAGTASASKPSSHFTTNQAFDRQALAARPCSTAPTHVLPSSRKHIRPQLKQEAAAHLTSIPAPPALAVRHATPFDEHQYTLRPCPASITHLTSRPSPPAQISVAGLKSRCALQRGGAATPTCNT